MRCLPNASALVVAAAALLHGCATTPSCHDATVLALAPVQEVPQVRTQADWTPHILELDLPDGVRVSLGPCRDTAMAGPVAGTVCMEVTVPVKTRLRFTSDRFEIAPDGGGPATTLRASPFAYQGTCTTQNGVRKCLGALEPAFLPDDEPVPQIGEGAGGAYRYITRTFAFDGEFGGAERPFLATVVPRSLLGAPASTLRLPDVIVNGRSMTFPRVRLETRSELVCPGGL